MDSRAPAVRLDDDLRTVRIWRTLDGPRPPQNPLARLIASAKGANPDHDAPLTIEQERHKERLRRKALRNQSAA